ncbi:MAG TPA: DHHA1 domain-containing protein, partial [Acidimicrobiales bacterium]|nr:DHHA1 domain-containing protein [Acidimicrobiales bacterium]
GDRPKSDAFLRDLGIDPTTSVENLAAEQTARLVRSLRERLESAGVLPEFIAVLDQERWFLPSHGLDAEELSNLQSATGRGGFPGVGVAMALGDARAFDRAREAETAWREGILRGLLRIEHDGVHAMTGVRWFESPEMTLAGTQAGMAMNYLLPPDRPVLVFSDVADSPTKVSGRGTLRLVDQGLDLSVALRAGAAAVGGEGGGHRVASGATIPPGTRDKFLEVVDRTVAQQLQLRGPG